MQPQVQTSALSLHYVQLQKDQVDFLKALLRHGSIIFRLYIAYIFHLNRSQVVLGLDAPPVCLCIKTELCDKATLKTWLQNHIRDRKRIEVTNFFTEVCCSIRRLCMCAS